MLRISEEEYQKITGRKTAKPETAVRSYTAMRSWETGKAFEDLIELQCDIYKKSGVAVIDKIPEPFLVQKKERNGMFTGRFTARKAQPDFQGTVSGGRSILIEAKSTAKDRISISVLTETQQNMLKAHSGLGAMCMVACRIGNSDFCVPWDEWDSMERTLGHRYATASELKRLGFEITAARNNPLPFIETYKRWEKEKTEEIKRA